MSEFVDVSVDAIYYYISAYTSLVSMVLITLCLVNILYHYRKIFHPSKLSDNKKSNAQNKLNYILYFLLAGVGLFICIQYGFVRRNRLTGGLPMSNFQCAFGLLRHHFL